MIDLLIRDLSFYSSLDESMLFAWLERLHAIKNVRGQGTDLHLCVDQCIHEDELRELIAVFFRFDVADKNQLSLFLTEQNKSWFRDNAQAYWYQEVFTCTD